MSEEDFISFLKLFSFVVLLLLPTLSNTSAISFPAMVSLFKRGINSIKNKGKKAYGKETDSPMCKSCCLYSFFTISSTGFSFNQYIPYISTVNRSRAIT